MSNESKNTVNSANQTRLTKLALARNQEPLAAGDEERNKGDRN